MKEDDLIWVVFCSN